ncbi:MAG: class I SAM-dependent methyltransferase [Rhodospirillales bacterium]|nr:class I SAM-dependent methyltransferase [Rhodospirillales bacterium]
MGNIRAIDWRLHIVFALADYCSNLDGDFVECGTYKGINAHGLIAYLDFGALDKDMYLLDTWTGLSEQALFDFEKDRAIRCYEDCFQEVKETFADTPNVHLIQGVIPDTLEEVVWGPIAFLHLDMNCTFPEKSALEFFWDKIVTGGVVISDDYGHPGYEEQKQMYEDFATSKGLTVLSLPTGTGVLFKP